MDEDEEERLLRIFPLSLSYCMWCSLDYMWQGQGLGGGRCSFFCSDGCKEAAALAAKQKETELWRVDK